MKVCPQGSDKYIECGAPFYYVKNSVDKSCSLTTQFYLIVFGSIIAFMILVFVAVIKVKHDRKKKQNVDNQLDSDRRLMSETQDPLYYGY